MTGFDCLEIPHPHGAFSVLPSRGRVYALTHHGEEVIWRPQTITDWNIGGDRLWVAPERDWHWTDISAFDLGKYKVAEAIDPGSWSLEKWQGNSLTVTQSFAVRHRRTENHVHGRIRRQFAFNEVLGRTIPGLQDPVGWITVDTLTLEGGTPGQGIGLWRILQVPIGGRMYVASAVPDRYRLHFGDDSGLVHAGPGGLEAEITGDQMYKIGMGQQGVTDLVAYARPLSPASWLVTARWFQVPADAVYLDTPMDQPGTPGDVIQIFNDSGVFGGFGELEVHGPGLKVTSGEDIKAMSQVSDTLVTLTGTMSPSDWEAWTASINGS